MRLFLDLDGVLSDFDRGVREVTGKRPEELPLKVMWAALARAPRFFETLAFMEDAEALWRFCQPHHPTILTGLPHGAWAPGQKRRWVARMLGAHVPVVTCMTREKPKWSGAGHVLVDDRLATREGWERKGGIFIHHLSAERSIAALCRLGFTGQEPDASPFQPQHGASPGAGPAAARPSPSAQATFPPRRGM
ncbi:hypothetical protein JYK14_02675 [Siccirubricoccus sp. KC 17139]|uniref:Uncharacterized protein n=1 Tax=Siccirubricoccus soli TaxID=2899147 RepID=A0ABT1CZL1_9PROT|nr:hypothetical protein [Siccirubricoccus soli]MCO6415084.1 hypothetical protein [Siccirubricoccus soli]MCP2681215.1 hypothetical protein [Siccirubricoccus soli]